MRGEAQNPFEGLCSARPRLMANDAAIARIEEAIKNSPAGKALKNEIVRKAKRTVGLSPVQWSESFIGRSRGRVCYQF